MFDSIKAGVADVFPRTLRTAIDLAEGMKKLSPASIISDYTVKAILAKAKDETFKFLKALYEDALRIDERLTCWLKRNGYELLVQMKTPLYGAVLLTAGAIASALLTWIAHWVAILSIIAIALLYALVKAGLMAAVWAGYAYWVGAMLLEYFDFLEKAKDFFEEEVAA